MKGMNDYDNRLKDCLEKKEIIGISDSFKNLKEETYEGDFDKYTVIVKHMYLISKLVEIIRIWCTDWDKTNESKNWFDTVNVDLSSDEF